MPMINNIAETIFGEISVQRRPDMVKAHPSRSERDGVGWVVLPHDIRVAFRRPSGLYLASPSYLSHPPIHHPAHQ